MANDHNHIHLFGDPEENFYILGKRDKSSFEGIYQQISMLCARNQIMAKVLKLTTEFNTHLSRKPDTLYQKYLSAYSEGMERPKNDLAFALLLPEIVASFNKWTPQLLGAVPGCSSLFVKHPETASYIHGRILDYALSGPFEKSERTILYEFNKQQKIFSYSTVGMPFPSLSSFNESGLSLALHYKHGKHFDLDGTSIFEITYDIISKCDNIREAIKLIKKQKSISYWGLYLADKNGEVASIDIKGHEVFQEKFDLNDHKYLYFNNRPLIKQNELEAIQPFGNFNQCIMRRDKISELIKKESLFNEKDPLLSIIKTLGHHQESKAKSAKNWKLSPLNTGSIQLYAVDLNNARSLQIPGQAPKFYEAEYYEYKNIFSKIEFHHRKNKNHKSSFFIQGMKDLSSYQSSFDIGDMTKAYHYIQLAIEKLKGHPEEIIARFYFLITQYLFESDKRDYTYLYEELLELRGKLPEYLNDHLILFLLRLSRCIGHSPGVSESDIKNKELKKYFKNEERLNPMALKALKHLIFPRVEILDIIYSY